MAAKKNASKSDGAKPKKEPKVLTDAMIDQMSRDAGKALSAQDKVLVCIALEEDEDRMWRGSINGYEYSFPRGVQVEVPVSVAKLIERSASVRYERKMMEQRMAEGITTTM